jgi:hypothetical protein
MIGHAVIEYGRATTIFSTGWKAEMFPLKQMMPPAELERWWQRTDFAVRCSLCPNRAWVWYTTPAQARQSADEHAAEHPGIAVKEIAETNNKEQQ